MRGVRDCVAKLILLLNMSNATGTETDLSLEGGEEGRMKAHQKKKSRIFNWNVLQFLFFRCYVLFIVYFIYNFEEIMENHV